LARATLCSVDSKQPDKARLETNIWLNLADFIFFLVRDRSLF
jgi:hypothetical protein